MRFMIMVKATQGTEAGVFQEKCPRSCRRDAGLSRRVGEAGVLLDASGCSRAPQGGRSVSGDKRSVVDGPSPKPRN